MIQWRKCAYRLFLVAFLCAAFGISGASPAHAACANPTGQQGEIIYNSSESLLQGCMANDTWQAFHEVGDGISFDGQCTQNPEIADAGNAWVQDSTKMDGAIDVAVSGNYAYVTGRIGDSLAVFDISDPLNPVIANSGNAWISDATKLRQARSVAIDGDYAYVVGGNTLGGCNSSFATVDISNPLNPTIANSGNAWFQDATKLNCAMDVEIQGDYAFVISFDGNSLTVVDISDPLNPAIADSGNAWITGWQLNSAYGLAISGTHAYVTSRDSNWVQAVDISDPLNPAFAGRAISLLDEPYNIAASGNFAYVASAVGDGITVLDISDPNNLTNSGDATVTDATKLNGAWGISVSGNFGYVVSATGDSLTVIDISNPWSPSIANAGNAWFSDATKLNLPKNLAVSGGYAFVPSGAGDSFTVVDLKDCVAPCLNPTRLIGEIFYNSSESLFQGCTANGWYALHDDGSGGVSDPCDPANTPSPGQTCDDGSIYAGLSPDGDVPMYTTPADAPSTYSWNDGTTNYTDMAMANCLDNSPGTAATCQTGETNTAFLVGATGEPDYPFAAAEYCGGLSAHGYSDWYLPAEDELNALYTNKDTGALNGTFNETGAFPAGYYWSSSEFSDIYARSQRFSDGSQSGFINKNYGLAVRCVRKNYVACKNPTGITGEILYNSSENLYQGCTTNGWSALHQ